MAPIVVMSVWLYQRLLRLYPRSYRSRFAVEQSRTYLDQCLDTYRHRGRLGIIRLTFANVVDLFSSLGKVRAEIPNALPVRFYVIEILMLPVMIFTLDPSAVVFLRGIAPWLYTALLGCVAVIEGYSVVLACSFNDPEPKSGKEA